MIRFPPAKINLGLHIVRKRADGYHDLETVFYPLPLYDVLEVIKKPSAKGSEFIFTGIPIPGDPAQNICQKAFELLKADFPQLTPIYLHLHKILPLGAGLGGGSADGAFALRMLNDQFQLDLPDERLIDYALQLGSDCPFFIRQTPCYATGRGEILEPVPLDLSRYSWLLVNPGIHVSTAEAFAGITPAPSSRSLKGIIANDPRTWKQGLANDFEISVFQKYPAIAAIKNQLYAAGALYASMSGSGSTVYGLFEKDRLPAPDFPAHYWVKLIR